MIDLYDMYHIVKDHGASALLLLAVVAGLLFVAFLYFKGKYDLWVSSIDRLIKSITEIQEETQRLRDSTQTTEDAVKALTDCQTVLASEEHWKHCPIDRCPNLLSISTAVNSCLEQIDKFSEDAIKSRSETRAIAEKIAERQDNLSNEIIGILRQIRVIARNGE